MPIEYFETDGGKLAVEIDGSGPPVICAPGLGDHRDTYTALATQLVNAGFTVARLDNRGHGDSSTTFTRYGDEATADDFLLLADKLGQGKRVALVGNSFAAGAATIAAGKKPDDIAGLVLLGPFLRNPNDFMTVWVLPLFFWKPWGPTFWGMYAKTLWPGLGDEGKAKRAAASRALLDRPGGYWAAFQKTVAGLDHRAVGPYVGKAGRTPALVVMGDKDPDFGKPKEEAEWVAGRFDSREVLMVDGSGHAPQIERPEVVGRKVEDFLRGLRSQGRF